jgi:hypothetical protein
VWYDCGDGSYAYYNDDNCGLQSLITTGSMSAGDIWYAKVYAYSSNTGHYVLEITGTPAGSYCAASGGGDEYISGVEIGSINNTGTGSDSYADYTNLSTDLTQGDTGVEITVTNGHVYTNDDLGVWIDWNQDEDFDDANENVVCSVDDGANGTYTFDVPVDALEGSTVMRVRIKWSGSDCGSSCGSTQYGEVEDYTINVQSAGPSYSWLTLNDGNEVSGTVVVGGADDDITVGFDATGLAEGTYNANITITSNDPDESPFVVPVTLTVSTQPEAPTNLTISINGSDVVLNWDAVAGATSYNIYRSTDPYNFGSSVYDTTATNSYTDSGAAADTKYFYYVTAE